MNLRTSDFLMTRFAQAAPRMLRMLAEAESDSLRQRLDEIPLDRPVFISGLARAGTTILLNVFATLPEVGTHRYRDFPFLFVPCWWSRFQDRLAREEAPVERPHKDRIVITKESPEAFEEPVWMHFFPDSHRPGTVHLLTGSDRNARFEQFYLEHLRKILLVRNAKRYVSKGNYNVTRIQYLAKLLPDARFIVPIRHPISHVQSLVRQHELFVEYSKQDPRVAQYMRAAGHFEFGPQRVPLSVDAVSARRIQEAWDRGEDDLGYAMMWRSVYGHVSEIALTPGPLADRIALVRYEDFCADPKRVLRRLFDFCGFSKGTEDALARLPPISAPQRQLEASGERRDALWAEVGDLAVKFGYRSDGSSESPGGRA